MSLFSRLSKAHQLEFLDLKEKYPAHIGKLIDCLESEDFISEIPLGVAVDVYTTLTGKYFNYLNFYDLFKEYPSEEG
jgi:hypothetical protein